jgi:hypothetical protein
MTSHRATLERMVELFQSRGEAAIAQRARDALIRHAE